MAISGGTGVSPSQQVIAGFEIAGVEPAGGCREPIPREESSPEPLELTELPKRNRQQAVRPKMFDPRREQGPPSLRGGHMVHESESHDEVEARGWEQFAHRLTNQIGREEARSPGPAANPRRPSHQRDRCVHPKV